MGVIDWLRRKDVQFSFDFDVFGDIGTNIHLKQLVLDTCATFIGRSLSTTEFRVRENGKFVRNEIYRRLNARPNMNQTASSFWQQVAYKLIYDNEVLIIQSETEDLLIADSFQHTKYAVFEDTFSNVTVRDYTFQRTFTQSQVMHIKLGNERLTHLIDSLYKDYGELFKRTMESQKRKNQLRSTVNLDSTFAKDPNSGEKLEKFVNRIFNSFKTKDVAIVPQEPGIEYKEHFNGAGNGILSVDEINKVTNGFFDQVATAIGIPSALIKGDMADVEKITRNYLMYTIKPILKKITDELNAKLFSDQDFLDKNQIEYYLDTYLDLFDIADKVEKLRGSGLFNGNEVLAMIGEDSKDDPSFEEYFMTKNFGTIEEILKGGENVKNEATL